MADSTLDFKDRVEDLAYRSRIRMIHLLGLTERSNQELRESLPTYHVESNALFKE